MMKKTNIQLSDHFSSGRLLRFTMPSIIMMVFTSVYMVVDGFFVSNFAGKTAFAAVNLIMPVLMILSTIGFMFGTGGSALVSKTLGEGEKEKANKIFSLIVIVSFILGVLLAIFGLIFIRPISQLLGAEGKMLEDCVVYSRVILCALPFYILQMLFLSFFSTAEKPKLGLYVTVIAGLTNMVLDAVLVGLLPQDLKLIGAALATAASQLVGGLIPLIYFLRKNSSLLKLQKTYFDGAAIGKVCVNGSSEFMSNISMSIISILYNIQLMKYAGENGIAAYGVMMYVSMIFSGVFLGYSIGSAPVVGFHYGANNKTELRGLLRKSFSIIGVFGVIMLIAAQILAYPLAHIFVGYDLELMNLTLSGFRIYAISFLFMGFAIYGSGFFTALNDGVTSAAISFLRTLLFQVACILILPIFFEINGIWCSNIAAEVMAVILTVVFLAVKQKRYGY